MNVHRGNVDYFQISLEANHVIPPNRVWIGSVSHGPNGVNLNGTFRSTGTFDYQVLHLVPSGKPYLTELYRVSTSTAHLFTGFLLGRFIYERTF